MVLEIFFEKGNARDIIVIIVMTARTVLSLYLYVSLQIPRVILKKKKLLCYRNCTYFLTTMILRLIKKTTKKVTTTSLISLQADGVC